MRKEEQCSCKIHGGVHQKWILAVINNLCFGCSRILCIFFVFCLTLEMGRNLHMLVGSRYYSLCKQCFYDFVLLNATETHHQYYQILWGLVCIDVLVLARCKDTACLTLTGERSFLQADIAAAQLVCYNCFYPLHLKSKSAYAHRVSTAVLLRCFIILAGW